MWTTIGVGKGTGRGLFGGKWVKYGLNWGNPLRKGTFCSRINPEFIGILTWPPLHKPVFCGRFVPVLKENVEYAADTNGGFEEAIC